MSFASLWGKQVSSEEPVTITTEELDTPLVINRAALVSGAEAVISVEIEGKSYALGTLRKDKKEHMALELRFWDILEESYKINVSGKGAKVDLTGYFHPPEGDDDLGMPFSDLDSENSEESSDPFSKNLMVEEVTDEEAEKALAAAEKKGDAKKKGKGKKGQSPEKPVEKTVEKPTEKSEEKREEKAEEKVEEKPAPGAKPPRKREREAAGSGQTTPKGNPAKKQKPNAKGEGAFKCIPCDRSFISENALQSHNTAKHK